MGIYDFRFTITISRASGEIGGNDVGKENRLFISSTNPHPERACAERQPKQRVGFIKLSVTSAYAEKSVNLMAPP